MEQGEDFGFWRRPIRTEVRQSGCPIRSSFFRRKAFFGHNSPMSPDAIQIRGARVNTLKDVSCDLPHEQITVITGPSGSGKSSLAFDTLYAEGQRRYTESMSTYARQFLARIEKPDVDEVRHILPAIALEQKNPVTNARSTVGTATETDDDLRLLFGHIGQTRCCACGGEVTRTDPLRIREWLLQLPEGQKVVLLAPISLKDHSPVSLLRQGFFRIFRNGDILDLASVQEELSSHETAHIVIDRLILRPRALGTRLSESIRNALMLGGGRMEAFLPETGETRTFRNAFACLTCGAEATEPFPAMFSFNNPLGACDACGGFGRIIGPDLDKVIPDTSLSLEQGAIHPFTRPAYVDGYASLAEEARKRGIPLDVPYVDLSDAQKSFVMDGGGNFEGVRGFFDWLETKKYKVHVRVLLSKYRGYTPCPECRGSRLKKDVLNVFLGDRNLPELCDMPIDTLSAFFDDLTLADAQEAIAGRVRASVQTRLRYLREIGLGYLTLNRPVRTLSSGEAQRIHLSAALGGGGLTDTLYVLDEPTVGLHARDTDRLIGTLKRLRDQGNTVVIVEHDPEVMMAADHILDMGPSGGDDGGRILFEGAPAALLDVPYSVTAQYLNHPPALVLPHTGGRSSVGFEPDRQEESLEEEETIEIRGARGNNLKNLTVRFPLHQLACVTGVSGSGKSTLIRQTLFAGYEQSCNRLPQTDVAPHDALIGLERFRDVLLVDQSPPGRSARSNPATYMKAYDEIRKLYADTRKAMIMGITPGHFSFNTPGGRCETCEGLGTLTIDMQFMADVVITCHDCQGRRFNRNVLSIDVNGKSIHDALNLTVDEAAAFFKNRRKIPDRLQPLRDMGLGYLKLGQSTATLSGGEAQRLKLASYLSSRLSGPAPKKADTPHLFLFDEPTTGLHMADIALLVRAFRWLLAAGHSVIAIEHNIDFIAHADYLLDLGPEGGAGGGGVVAEGSVADVMACESSHTGRFLKKRLTQPAIKQATP